MCFILLFNQYINYYALLYRLYHIRTKDRPAEDQSFTENELYSKAKVTITAIKQTLTSCKHRLQTLTLYHMQTVTNCTGYTDDTPSLFLN